MMTIEYLFKEATQLSIHERLHLIELLTATVKTELANPTEDWHAALRATYGILADDPIESPSQLPLEERETIG
jgi:hypothetical protein